MAAKKVKGWAWVRRLKPYNMQLIALGIVLDGAAVAWVYFEALPIHPFIYGAISGVLKMANLAIHFVNSKLIKEDGDDDQADAAASQ